MNLAAFEHHLASPQGYRHVPSGASTVVAEGGACCDRIRFSLRLEGDRVLDAGFEAEGCGAATAAGSAAVSLIRGSSVLAAARLGPADVAAELGGLSQIKQHAAELAADALHRALGAAACKHARLAKAQSGRMLVAMSGGVDSAVAALSCAKSSETVAVTLELWADPENDAERSCCSSSAVAQARSIAHSLGLAHLTVDLREEFREGVVEPFIAEYAAGETPNPCVRCNGRVRLEAMLDLADRLGCEKLATGHYARVADTGHPAGPLLRAAADASKDQTYMLAALSPHSLARMCFPLGGLKKAQVRRIAAEAGLAVADKSDSQDLCFLAGTDRSRFLARHGGIGETEGEIVDRDGAVIGRHRGQHHFTIGQRKGLGALSRRAHKRGVQPAPLYVLAKDARSNRVTVGPRSGLESDTVALKSASLHRYGSRVSHVKLRYRSRALRARVLGDRAPGVHRSLQIELHEPAEAVAPGQIACLLDGELVVGWGTIAHG